MEEEKKVKEAAQEIRTAATAKLKCECRRTVAVCQLCDREKSCQKCYGLFLCTACNTIINHTKKRPDLMRKAWEQFGPGDTLDRSAGIDGVDFGLLLDVLGSIKALEAKRELTPAKKEGLIKYFYEHLKKNSGELGHGDTN